MAVVATERSRCAELAGRWYQWLDEVQREREFDVRSHIEQRDDISGGDPVIKGTRITLRTIWASLVEGASADEIVDDFPSVSHADVRAAIQLAAALAQETMPAIEPPQFE